MDNQTKDKIIRLVNQGHLACEIAKEIPGIKVGVVYYWSEKLGLKLRSGKVPFSQIPELFGYKINGVTEREIQVRCGVSGSTIRSLIARFPDLWEAESKRIGATTATYVPIHPPIQEKLPEKPNSLSVDKAADVIRKIVVDYEVSKVRIRELELQLKTLEDKLASKDKETIDF
jgi:transposase